jgi:hypothetical protein
MKEKIFIGCLIYFDALNGFGVVETPHGKFVVGVRELAAAGIKKLSSLPNIRIKYKVKNVELVMEKKNAPIPKRGKGAESRIQIVERVA